MEILIPPNIILLSCLSLRKFYKTTSYNYNTVITSWIPYHKWSIEQTTHYTAWLDLLDPLLRVAECNLKLGTQKFWFTDEENSSLTHFTANFTKYWINTRHVCTHLNTHFMRISNIVTNCHNFLFVCVKFLTCRLLVPAAL